MKKEPIDQPDSWSPDPRHADPLQDRLHALVEEWDSSAPFGADWTHDAADAMRGALAELASLQATLRETQQDMAIAAGEFVVPLPEPGTDMARMLIANRLLKGQLMAAEATLRAAQVSNAELLEKLRKYADNVG